MVTMVIAMPGKYRDRWDEKDESGTQLPNRIYFLMLERGESKSTKRLFVR